MIVASMWRPTWRQLLIPVVALFGIGMVLGFVRGDSEDVQLDTTPTVSSEAAGVDLPDMRRRAAVLSFGGGLDALITPAPTIAPALSEPTGDDLEERLALAALVSATFPDWPLAANHVVWAESIGDWTFNISPTFWREVVYGGYWSVTRDCGLLQTNEIHRDKYEAHGWDMDVDCFVPERNLVIAREIYDAQGPGAWTTAR